MNYQKRGNHQEQKNSEPNVLKEENGDEHLSSKLTHYLEENKHVDKKGSCKESISYVEEDPG